MSCRKTQDVDLSGFLAEPRGREFAAFREHYPACAECAAEVRAWTELHLQLRGPTAHPEPQLLLRYQDEPASLAPERRTALAGHLEACASCRDELRALGAFDPAAAAAPARVATGDSPLERLGAALRSALWQPALAYGLVLLLLVPLVLQRWGDVSEPAPLSLEPQGRTVQTAQRTEPPRADLPAPDAKESAPTRETAASAPTALASPGKAQADRAEPPAENLPESVRVKSVGLLEEAESERRVDLDAFAASAPEEPPAEKQAASGGRLSEADSLADESVRRELQPKLESASKLPPPDLYSRLPRQRLVAGEAGAYAPRLDWQLDGDSVAIEIPHPPLREGERQLEVRILHADGRHQLVERVDVDPALPTTTIRVYSAWFGPTPATHAVEVTIPGDPPSARRLFSHSLTLR